MAKLIIGGQTYDIAPYKLGAMRKAAPHIDRVNATAGALTSIEGVIESVGELLAVLSIGLVKIDPALTPEHLEEEIFGLGDAPAVREAFQAVLLESGMLAGEATAPATAPEAAGALTTDSEKSSTN